jgi:hypothetical protein
MTTPAWAQCIPGVGDCGGAYDAQSDGTLAVMQQQQQYLQQQQMEMQRQQLEQLQQMQAQQRTAIIGPGGPEGFVIPGQ